MLLRETPRPCAGREILKRLWLADAVERGPHDSFDQIKGAQRDAAIGFYPIPKILPELRLKDRCPMFTRHRQLVLRIQTELRSELFRSLLATFPCLCAAECG